jgi:hypothetical protein
MKRRSILVCLLFVLFPLNVFADYHVCKINTKVELLDGRVFRGKETTAMKFFEDGTYEEFVAGQYYIPGTWTRQGKKVFLTPDYLTKSIVRTIIANDGYYHFLSDSQAVLTIRKNTLVGKSVAIWDMFDSITEAYITSYRRTSKINCRYR